jgi:hypothetical protein
LTCPFLPELEIFRWPGRKVYLAFDADQTDNVNVLQAPFARRFRSMPKAQRQAANGDSSNLRPKLMNGRPTFDSSPFFGVVLISGQMNRGRRWGRPEDGDRSNEGEQGQVPSDLVRGTARIPGLRSPWNKTRGILHFGRTFDKFGCSLRRKMGTGQIERCPPNI